MDEGLHVAIIMDGNGRWAAARGRPRTMGHKAGIDAVRRTLDAAREKGVRYLTLYSFSSENWNRPEEEVHELMSLLRFYLKNELASLDKNKVRLRIIGDRGHLDPDIAAMIARAEEQTKKHESFNLTLALSYGGRQEIVRAARLLAEKASKGEIAPEQVDEKQVASHLYTHDLPDPDLVIRTSGEMRISNFLLWQSAYAEYVFSDVLWPDFGAEHLAKALEDYKLRERRFGR